MLTLRTKKWPCNPSTVIVWSSTQWDQLRKDVPTMPPDWAMSKMVSLQYRITYLNDINCSNFWSCSFPDPGGQRKVFSQWLKFQLRPGQPCCWGHGQSSSSKKWLKLAQTAVFFSTILNFKSSSASLDQHINNITSSQMKQEENNNIHVFIFVLSLANWLCSGVVNLPV